MHHWSMLLGERDLFPADEKTVSFFSISLRAEQRIGGHFEIVALSAKAPRPPNAAGFLSSSRWRASAFVTAEMNSHPSRFDDPQRTHDRLALQHRQQIAQSSTNSFAPRSRPN